MFFALTAFILVSVTFYCIALLLSKNNFRKISSRLNDVNENKAIKTIDKNRKSIFASIDSSIKNISLSNYIKRQLNLANLQLKVSEYIVIVFISATLIPSIYLLFNENIRVTTGLIVIGTIIPVVYLKHRQTRRKNKFNIQLLDAIALISNSLKSGHSFLQAIDLVTREMLPPISEEFSKLLREIKLGIPFEKAIDSMIDRVGNYDLELIMTCVKIQREIGGNLSELLDKIAATIRDRIRIRGQVQTLTAQGKLSGMILSVMPIVLAGFIFIVNPEYVNVLIVNPIGKLMIIISIFSQIIGVFIIRKIVNIKI